MTMPAGRDAPTQIAPRTERWLPHALVATAFVVVFPALVVWMVVPRGEPVLLALSVPLGMLLSVLAAAAGGALWKRVPGSRDLVFADLMLWGWLRRLRAERRLAHAKTLLGTHAEGLSVQSLSSLSALLEARDSFTYGHSQRVTRHAERIAGELGLSASEVAQVRTAAALHDVGKLHTPRDIVTKPGRLTDDEFAVIRKHPGDGADMSTSVGDPAITAMIRHHHERLDGAGYPDGLAADAIPLGARIIAVADTFDAMTSNRAYRRAASHKRALDVLRQEAGKQLDADAVAAFVGYYRGRRTVAWSAFAMAAPQRLFAWLGGISPGLSAGAAGAAVALIGLGSPQAPVISAGSVATSRPTDRAEVMPARKTDVAIRGPRRFVRDEIGERSVSRRAGIVAPRKRAVARMPAAHETPPPARTPPAASTPAPQPQPAPVVEPPRPTPPPADPQPAEPGRPLPQIELPEIALPELKLPLLELPGVRIPQVEVPAVQLP
jgi:putative nucleotidyltransferase with HDIG domain